MIIYISLAIQGIFLFALNVENNLGLFIWYISKIFQKTDISYPLIRTRTCTYQGVRNVSFSEILSAY